MTSMNTKFLHLGTNMLLAASLVWLGINVWQSRTHPPTNRGPKVPFAFTRGTAGPVVKGVDYSLRDRSLVVFVSTTCHYCEASIPFYNKLHALSLDPREKLGFYAVFPEPEGAVRDAKARLGLVANTLSGVRFQDIGVHSTPTSLLIDRRGLIAEAWIGTSETVESDITSHLNGLQR